MSGIVGVVETGGTPVDQPLLERMTRFMEFRGPDAVNSWSEGPAGFGHTMLRTSDQAINEVQPCSLDGRFWITADVRLDARAELIDKLRSGGEPPRADVTDPELLLHAYRLWGQNLVDHIIGDFAFAIWDIRDRTLFCARDHMGVKLFYYINKQSTFAFSNTMRCLQLHPKVTNAVNDLAIGDFLIAGLNTDLATTMFADIMQLAPAHALFLSGAGVQLRRYWMLPVPTEIHYKKSSDYVEHFDELLRAAVADRVSCDSVSVFMSGGLDSPALAVHASAVGRSRSGARPLHAITLVGPSGDGNERYYATVAASALGIPIQYIDGGTYNYFDDWISTTSDFPEPCDDPLMSLGAASYEAAAHHGRVLLTGFDGDSLLAPSRGNYVRYLLDRRLYGKFLRTTALFLYTQRRFPKIGLRAALSGNFAQPRNLPESGYPPWLNPGFERDTNLTDRYTAFRNRKVPPEYLLRETSFRTLSDNPEFNYLFTDADPGITGLPVESRHPLVDVRLISFCMALPQVPFLLKKHILRESMRGALPEEVLNRPKTTFSGFKRTLSYDYTKIRETFLANQQIKRYVDPSRVPHLDSQTPPTDYWVHIRPLELSYWLESKTGGQT